MGTVIENMTEFDRELLKAIASSKEDCCLRITQSRRAAGRLVKKGLVLNVGPWCYRISREGQEVLKTLFSDKQIEG